MDVAQAKTILNAAKQVRIDEISAIDLALGIIEEKFAVDFINLQPLIQERDTLLANVTTLTTEKQTLTEEKETLLSDKNTLIAEKEALETENAALKNPDAQTEQPVDEVQP